MGSTRFGPAGTPTQYKGRKSGIPAFLNKMGLDALEYQCVYGVKISEKDAIELGAEAERYDVKLSLHAPYYINLNGSEETIEKSVERLVKSAWAAEKMNAYRIVFHPGFYGGKTSEEALKTISESLKSAVEEAIRRGIRKFTYGPETMGKIRTFGTLDEIIKLCLNVGEHVLPTIDFAHIHARTRGGLRRKDDILKIIERVEREVGKEAVKPLHCHFTQVEYGERGEKKHLIMGKGGPDFRIIAEALVETGVDAVIISESPILEIDSLKMKEIYEKLKRG
ncbi:deoxyribonuclease IV [Candidatus Geothermarchaeota archaeon]|nr:MAG: deoxyribonuclease IV [Candidatus Geothermarchaeota archaeon]